MTRETDKEVPVVGMTDEWSHTVGCNCFKIFATPGSQNSVQTYSRQYQQQ